MTDEQEGKPKIVVDSDWKEQVQAEKEAAELKKDETDTQPEAEQESAGQIPPASFPLLVSSMATQALMSMGQIPDPEGKVHVHLEYAKHSIEMLGVIDEKTKGNLTTEEASMMEHVLHELRMAYVVVSKAPDEMPNVITPEEG